MDLAAPADGILGEQVLVDRGAADLARAVATCVEAFESPLDAVEVGARCRRAAAGESASWSAIPTSVPSDGGPAARGRRDSAHEHGPGSVGKAASYASRVARTPDDLPRPTQAPVVPRWVKVWILTMGLGASLLLVAALNGNDTVVPAGILLAALAGRSLFCTWVTDRTRDRALRAPRRPPHHPARRRRHRRPFAALFSSRFFFDPTGTGVLWVGPLEEIAELIVPLGIYVFVRKYRSVEQALAYALVSAAGSPSSSRCRTGSKPSS